MSTPPPSGSTLAHALAQPRIAGLDFLRAIAVIFVVVEHGLDTPGAERWRHFVSGMSSLGVEIFFVLSGFLITGLLLAEHDRGGRIDFFEFYKRRLSRLMPAFYLFIASVVAIAWLRGRTIDWAPFVASLLYVVNYYQGLTGAKENVVAHCWSLAVEEQFYLLWPIALALLLAGRHRLARWLIILIAAVWAWRALLYLSGGASTSYLYRALETRADHLAVGCLLAVALRNLEWRRRIEAVCLRPRNVALMTLALAASARLDGAFPAYKYVIGFAIEPCLIALLLSATIAVATTSGRAARLINNAALAHVGKVSYGIYLFHGAIMYTVQRIVEAHTGSVALAFACASLAVLAFATAMFRWYELPLRNWINRRAVRGVPVTA